MSITTYSELQTAIASWLNRAGDTIVTTPATDFIALFESELRLNPDFRTREMEARYTASLSTQYLALPSDFLEMRNLVITSTNPVGELKVTTQAAIRNLYGHSQTGQPRVYAVVGSELLFAPSPASTYTVEMDYYAFTALSGSATTNWLLTKYPQIYLAGSLVEAGKFLENDAVIQRWEPRLAASLAKLDVADQAARWNGAPLTMRNDTGTP